MKKADGKSLLVLGLSGSIGMGKTTVAEMFKAEGVPVFSSDEAVHELYCEPHILTILENAFPGAVQNGIVDRSVLSAYIIDQPQNLKKLGSLIHPHVRTKEQAFLDNIRQQGGTIALLDIPLLFETGAENRVDYTIVVSASKEAQKQRVLKRPGMTEKKLNAILAHQMDDAEKRVRADFVIDTGKDIKLTRQDVHFLLKQLRTLQEKDNA